jgi:hypothetical protein
MEKAIIVRAIRRLGTGSEPRNAFFPKRGALGRLSLRGGV